MSKKIIVKCNLHSRMSSNRRYEGLKNQRFSIILVKVYSGINYQWILNLEDSVIWWGMGCLYVIKEYSPKSLIKKGKIITINWIKQTTPQQSDESCHPWSGVNWRWVPWDVRTQCHSLTLRFQHHVCIISDSNA